jgi:hypothetical protein
MLMHSDDAQLLLAHLRRSVRNFALYEAVASGAVTAVELAERLGVPKASLQVKLHRARDAAREVLEGNDLLSFLPAEEAHGAALE